MAPLPVKIVLLFAQNKLARYKPNSYVENKPDRLFSNKICQQILISG